MAELQASVHPSGKQEYYYFIRTFETCKEASMGHIAFPCFVCVERLASPQRPKSIGIQVPFAKWYSVYSHQRPSSHRMSMCLWGCVCVHVCVHPQIHVESRGQHWVSFLITLCFISIIEGGGQRITVWSQSPLLPLRGSWRMNPSYQAYTAQHL